MSESQEKIFIDAEDEEEAKPPDDKRRLRLLVFALGDETYCVDVGQAKEVLRLPETTRVPNTPPFVVGAANLRGDLLSLLDLHHFFGVDRRGKVQDGRVIVSDAAGEPIGLLVDQVRDTLSIEEDRIEAPLATLKGRLADYTKGEIPLDGEVLIYLDLEKILGCDEISKLRKGESS
jgi:chemotaxis signal transduction protein